MAYYVPMLKKGGKFHPLHIIDIEDSEEEDMNAGLVADQVEVDVVVPDKVAKEVDYTITLHQKCTLWNGKGGKRMVVMKTVFFYYK